MSLTIRDLRSKLFNTDEFLHDKEIQFMYIDADSGNIDIKFKESLVNPQEIKGLKTCPVCNTISNVKEIQKNIIILDCNQCEMKRRLHSNLWFAKPE